MDGGVTAGPVLKVDAASWYFVKGYTDAPRVCGFEKPVLPEKKESVEKCLEIAMGSWKLPTGWVIKEVPRGSELLEEYRMAYLHIGSLYSAIKHKTFLPKTLDSEAVEKARLCIAKKQLAPSDTAQAEYDDLLHKIRELEKEANKINEEIWRSGSGIPFAGVDREKGSQLADEISKKEKALAQAKDSLWSILFSALERKVAIVYDPTKGK